MKRFLLIIYIIFLCFPFLFATHQRAGNITYEHISGLTYKFTITTYVYTKSLAYRPSLDILWGDGTNGVVPQDSRVDLGNDITRCIYYGTHTYNAIGTYTITLEDPNRNGGINNIPNSVNIPFFIQTELVINPFLGSNNSPELLNPPIDKACVNQLYMHNPGAYDKDGDSLSYRLVICKGEQGLDIPGYELPNKIPPSASTFTLDAQTGDLIWNCPVAIGEYNIAILIEEWRSGVKIGSVTRDMQITVLSCNNHPPVIENIIDTCVEAGDTLTFVVMATDPDLGDIIVIEGIGGPFVLPNSPALFGYNQGKDTVYSTFYWETNCSHVRRQPYQALIKATDNSSPVKLVDYETFFITVVGPAPENLTADPFGNTIKLKWNTSVCDNAIGYRVYRREGYYGYIHGYCETGVPAYTGYVQIADISNINDTTYIDNNGSAGLIPGIDYCYIVIAYFPDGAESYASLEACATLIKDVPIITNVSIRNTDKAKGSAYIAWSKPTVMDTTIFTEPFKYLIQRSEGFLGSNFVLIDSTAGINDTTYIDTLINTTDYPYSYKINLYGDSLGKRTFVGSTQTASSVYLSIAPSDNVLILSWEEHVPWTNNQYVIYKQNPTTLLFDLIAWVDSSSYTDTGLVNGKSYCYYVKSIGNYSASGFVNPIINFSQITCGVPIDTIPPCAPELYVIPDCDNVENYLLWTNSNHTCANDVIKYNIYYSATKDGSFELIHTNNNSDDTTYLHTNIESIAGCYAVTAVDSFMNESKLSNIVCIDIDSCDLYRLPNVFTPNGDNHNDFFIPFPYNFVDRIDINIYNRWGQIIFNSEDPDINWDGKNQFTKQECPEGVYFYVCDVYELRLEGIIKRTINGFVHLLK